MAEALEQAQEKKATKNAFPSKPRYNGIVKKRRWEDPPEDGIIKDFDPSERVKKRKSLILLGYSGVNYFGMQRNPAMKTIEEELLTAMRKQKWITEEAFKQPQTIQFQRAARTDKGVSAAQQCVSAKLPETLDIDALNADLPEQIRVFAVKRVTKSFNSKGNCDARTYTYTLPTFAFADHTETVDVEKYRLPDDKLETINDTLKLYEGTKNFHNFTKKKLFFDPSSKRFIISFHCDRPFVPKGTSLEFAVIKIKGQSFMLHQIRKMVGLMLAVVRGHTTRDTLTKGLTQDRVNVPVAPGLGLVLAKIHYDTYNTRYGDDGVHEALTFTDEEEKIQQFVDSFITSTIVDTEHKTHSMEDWLETLSLHIYDTREEDQKQPTDKEDKDDDDEDE